MARQSWRLTGNRRIVNLGELKVGVPVGLGLAAAEGKDNGVSGVARVELGASRVVRIDVNDLEVGVWGLSHANA
jgi:hypothetical protein